MKGRLNVPRHLVCQLKHGPSPLWRDACCMRTQNFRVIDAYECLLPSAPHPHPSPILSVCGANGAVSHIPKSWSRDIPCMYSTARSYLCLTFCCKYIYKCVHAKGGVLNASPRLPCGNHERTFVNSRSSYVYLVNSMIFTNFRLQITIVFYIHLHTPCIPESLDVENTRCHLRTHVRKLPNVLWRWTILRLRAFNVYERAFVDSCPLPVNVGRPKCTFTNARSLTLSYCLTT